MTDDIPFDRTFDLEPGVAKEIAPEVRAFCAGNAAPFTFKGTVSYIVGRGNVAIIDPGPDDERHIAALLGAVRGETVTHILVTHTHRDHSPAAAARQGRDRRADLWRRSTPRLAAAAYRRDQSARRRAATWISGPITRCADGETVEGSGWTLEAIATPGHMRQPHGLCAEGNEFAVFGRSRHGAGRPRSWRRPDGAMSDYMASLDKLADAKRDRLFPRPRRCRSATRRASCSTISATGTGAKHRSCTGSRRARPIFRPWCARSISASIRGSSARPALSVLAHLEDLVARGLVVTDGAPSIAGIYRLGD